MIKLAQRVRVVTIDGIEIKVISATRTRVKEEVGPFRISFAKTSKGKVVKETVFFLSSNSYEDIPPVPNDMNKAALKLARIIFHHFNGHREPPREVERERKEPVQLTLFK